MNACSRSKTVCCEKHKESRILTIPNILSFIRLGLIPVIIWLYLGKKDPLCTAVVIVLSGFTDVVDGFIARRFNMVSNFGKALDPIADKLTQASVLVCLITRFPYMVVPFGLMVIKEVVSGIFEIVIIRSTHKVIGADWHGKLTTVLLYTMMILHTFWFNIPAVVSNISIAVCTAMMLVSFVLYSITHIRIIKTTKK